MSLGKTNAGEAFQLNERKCKKLKIICSNSVGDALEAVNDNKVVLSSLNI